MESRLNIEFLKLEFRKLYEDINRLFNYKGLDLIKEFNNIIKYIVLLIFEKNKLLYDDDKSINDNVIQLYKKNIIPNKMFRSISLLLNQIALFYDSNNSEDCQWFDIFMGKYYEKIYDLLVFVAINCGDENYSLIYESLTQWQKNIFDKYLKDYEEDETSSENENKKLSKEEIKENSKLLVEKGEKYYFGRGVRKNNKEAFKYFLDAAKYDNETAQAYLGLFFERGLGVERNYEFASKWYNKAAVKGNGFAQYSLGMLYQNGNGVEKDYKKALLWIVKSSENEYAPSYYQLGRMYYNALGVEKNIDLAFKWYKKGADEDFPAAQHALSFMYKNGEGCEKNIVKAYYWIEKAAENDYDDAYFIVGKSYLDGICFDADYEKAYTYLKKGYDAFDTDCIESLGDMYYKGLYVEKDISKAIELYNRSIECGNTDLYYKIGKVYEEEDRKSEAIISYELGGKLGDVKCIQRLGIIYYNGEGVKRDLDKAIKYIEIAAENKAPHAMYMLAIAYLRLNKFGEDTMNITRRLLEEAYEAQSPYAAEYLVTLILKDIKDGKQVDEKKLLEYIDFAYDNGIVGALFQFGYIHEKGIVVDVNLEKAYSYYKIAADKNNTKAILKLAGWYKIGKYVNQDIDQAIKLYSKAAESNEIEALENLINIYEKGIGDRPNERKALLNVFKLIDIDALKGKSKLAYYCLKGIGIEVDSERANEIITEIEDIDKGTANNLKCFLAENSLLEMTKDEIINTYMEGIELGNSDCYGNLAMYLYNNNLYKDKKYQEKFESAMQGKELGIRKCRYVYLKDMLRKKEKDEVISEEEFLIVKDLKVMVEKGIYDAIYELLRWYHVRGMENNKDYFDMEKQINFYNLKKEEKVYKKLSRKETLDIITITSVVLLVITIIISIVK